MHQEMGVTGHLSFHLPQAGPVEHGGWPTITDPPHSSLSKARGLFLSPMSAGRRSRWAGLADPWSGVLCTPSPTGLAFSLKKNCPDTCHHADPPIFPPNSAGTIWSDGNLIISPLPSVEQCSKLLTHRLSSDIDMERRLQTV